MRRKRKFKKDIKPDPKYNNTLVSQFINHLMKAGKKSVAQKIFYQSFDILKKKNKDNDPMDIFDSAVKNASPLVEVKSRRIGGARYQIPREVRGERRLTLAIRWIIQAARSGKGKSMAEKLSDEFMLAAKNEGAAIKKKEDTHKVAEANKAFAHFGW